MKEGRPRAAKNSRAAFLSKTTHPFEYKFFYQKNNDRQTNYYSAIIPSEHMKGV